MTAEDTQQPSTDEIEQRQAEAQELAQRIWADALTAVDHHPYAALWGVSAQKLKVYRGDLTIEGERCDGALVMPARDAEQVVWNVGFITALSRVRFLPGGRISSTYFGWGRDRSTIVVSRGFTKAAEIHAATGHAVAVAFTVDNVQNVVGIMRSKYPAALVVPATDFQFVSQRSCGETVADTVGAAVALANLESARDELGRPRSADRASASLSVEGFAEEQRQEKQDPIPDSPYAKKLLAWIKRKGRAELTSKQVLQLGPSCVRNAEAAKSALQTLVEQGYLITDGAHRYRVTSVVQSLREGSLKALKANLGTAATGAGANGATTEAATAPATVAERVATDALAASDAGDSP